MSRPTRGASPPARITSTSAATSGPPRSAPRSLSARAAEREPDPSRLIAQHPGSEGTRWVVPDCHCGRHAQEPESAVELLGPRVGVQNDLLVAAGQSDQSSNDLAAEPTALM